MDTHKNARLTPKGREEMVRAVVDRGMSKAAAARQFNTTPRKPTAMPNASSRPRPRCLALGESPRGVGVHHARTRAAASKGADCRVLGSRTPSTMASGQLKERLKCSSGFRSSVLSPRSS